MEKKNPSSSSTPDLTHNPSKEVRRIETTREAGEHILRPAKPAPTEAPTEVKSNGK